MIKFRCPECGEVLKADESQIGKKAKCVECGEIVVVHGSAQEIHRPSVITPSVPRRDAGEEVEKQAADYVGILTKAGFATLGLLVLAMVAIGIYMFVSRDTWEKDNSAKIN